MWREGIRFSQGGEGGGRYGGVKGNGHGLICSCFIPDDDDKAATGMFKHQSSSPM